MSRPDCESRSSPCIEVYLSFLCTLPVRRSVNINSPIRMKATRGKQLTRRSVLWHLLGTGMYLPFATGLLGSSPKQEERHAVPARPPSRTSLSPEDDQFLDELERLTYCYFWEQASPETGIVKDRCRGAWIYPFVTGARSRPRHPARSLEQIAESSGVFLPLG